MFKIYGIGSVQAPDKVGEVVDLKGIDTTNLRYLSDEHATDDKGGGMFAILGSILTHKKIFKAEDCATPREKRCWDVAKAPFLYFEGALAPNHPNAQSAEALIKWCAENPDGGLRVGASIEGGILQRAEGDQKHLEKTLGEGIALTIKPMMPRCSVFPMQDLQKSDTRTVLPAAYVERLKKSSTERAFVELSKSEQVRRVKERLAVLKKSAAGSISSMKCWKCGENTSFFIGPEVPNRCPKCSSAMSMSAIFKAIKNPK